MSNSPGWLTPAEAGARIGKSARTITRMIDDGELPAVRTEGGQRRIRSVDFEAYLLRLTRPADRVCQIVVFANQKGGVGKTTATANLGVALTQLGAQVLLVDFDPQGHLTFTMGHDPERLERTIYHAILTPDTVPLRSVILQTAFGPDLAPINIEASTIDEAIANRAMWGGFLANALEAVHDQYDYILIDSAPNLGKLTIMAFIAADYVVIPTQLQMLSVRGIHLLIERIDQARADANRRLQIAGILPMMAQRSKADQSMNTAIRTALAGRAIRVFATAVPFSTDYKSMANARTIMTHFDPTGRYSQPYQAVLAELLAVIGGAVAGRVAPAGTRAPVAGAEPVVGVAHAPHS